MDKEYTLEELMKRVDPKETVFIGAASGYLFIGNLDTYKADFDQINADIMAKDNSIVETCNEAIDQLNQEIERFNTFGDGEELRSIKSKLDKIKKSLYQREVVDVYRKMMKGDDAGIAVIIRGGEPGKYWFKEEYDNKEGEYDEAEV